MDILHTYTFFPVYLDLFRVCVCDYELREHFCSLAKILVYVHKSGAV